MSKITEASRDHIADENFAFPKERKEPIHDAAHVRNAIARFKQVQGVTDSTPPGNASNSPRRYNKVELTISEALERLRRFNGQALKLDRRGADKEAADTLTLTLRYFLNEHYGIALEQMRDLYELLPIPEEDKDKARGAFARYQAFLKSPIGVNFKGTTLTNWNIIETILDGDGAEAKKGQRPIFEEWQESAPSDPYAHFYNEDAVSQTIQFVLACQRFNEWVIKRLESEQTEDGGSQV